MAGLLEEACEIVTFFNNKYYQTGEKLNFFSISNTETDEVALCKVIASFLNPDSSHFQGNIFLDLFLELIQEDKVQNDEHISVYTEFVISEKRRIDIIIMSGKRFIPIEVKVHATDQNKQCSDYFEFSKNYGAKKVFYLTLDGHSPKDSSKSGLVLGENLITLSFKKEILQWIAKCEILNEIQELFPIKEMLRQFKQNIRKLCDFSEDIEMEKQILVKILESKESMQSANEISQIVSKISNSEEIWKNMDFNNEAKYFEEFIDGSITYNEKDKWWTFNLIEKIDIDFYLNFKYVFVATTNLEVSNKIRKSLLENEKYKGKLLCSGISEHGFSINEIQNHFLSTDGIFSIYKSLTTNRENILKKMKDLLTIIYNAIE